MGASHRGFPGVVLAAAVGRSPGLAPTAAAGAAGGAWRSLPSHRSARPSAGQASSGCPHAPHGGGWQRPRGCSPPADHGGGGPETGASWEHPDRWPPHRTEAPRIAPRREVALGRRRCPPGRATSACRPTGRAGAGRSAHRGRSLRSKASGARPENQRQPNQQAQHAAEPESPQGRAPPDRL